MNVETIGWITRAVLALICVITICTLALMGHEVPAMLNTVTTGLLTAFVVGRNPLNPSPPFKAGS